jgi:CRP-like cAMP-binding protein
VRSQLAGGEPDPGRPADGDPPVSASLSENELLASLPRAVHARLANHLHPVRLGRKELLFRSHEPLRFVYFPTTAVVSLVLNLASGSALEVGLVGRDGFAGALPVPGVDGMPCDGVVQIPGAALRIDEDVLRDELQAEASLYDTMERYLQVLLSRTMHLAACNMFHPVEQRCIRWLLTVSDLTGSDRIALTHELLATMLGVRRPTVTLAVGALSRAGFLDEHRRAIVIRDRAGLEAGCCECYRAMRDEHRRVRGF